MRLPVRNFQIFLCVMLGAFIQPAIAQTYPAKAIRFIVGYAPSGPNDILARLVGQKLAESLAVPVTVDNRPGADSIIGTEMAARSAPDGYTIVMVSASATIHPNVYTNMTYNIVRDFAPVTVLAASTYVVVVNSAVPAGSIKELIALAKAKPGQLNFASSGVGGALHLAGELFKSMAGVDMNHVAYKGGAPSMADLVGGHVEVMFSPMVVAVAHIKSGRLRALGVTGAKRWPTMPDVPTVAEAGVPGYEVTGWYGVLAPGGTPRAIIARLNMEISQILKLPDIRQRLAGFDLEPVGNSPEQMASHINMELVKWAKVAKDANISLGAIY
jgi:tripartite-type tricarboxylate transporter receptor subunit TctC